LGSARASELIDIGAKIANSTSIIAVIVKIFSFTLINLTMKLYGSFIVSERFINSFHNKNSQTKEFLKCGC